MKELCTRQRSAWKVTFYKFYNDMNDMYECKIILFHRPSNKSYTGYLDLEDYDKFKDKNLVVHRHGNGIHMAYFYDDENGIKHIQYVHRKLLSNDNPLLQIDHINTNGLDNRKYNLRIVTPSINVRNNRLRSDNKSGRKGIQYHYVNKKLYQIEACVRDFNKKRIRKTWYIDKYGYDEAMRLANEWLDEMQPKYNTRISRITSKDLHKLH